MLPRLTSVAFRGRFRPSRARPTGRCVSGGGSLGSASPPPGITGTIPRLGVGIRVGQSAEVLRSFTDEDVATFGRLVGDLNPVHFPDGGDEKRKRPVVHGMLVASLFSSVFGTLVPGSVYRSQNLRFERPVRVGDRVKGRVVVAEARAVSSSRTGEGVICTCLTTVIRARAKDADGGMGDSSADDEEEICVSGEARVWLPGATVGREC